jgi:hypothetical protein
VRRVDIMVGAFAVAFGAFWIWQSAPFEFIDQVPGPGFLPMVLAVTIVVLGTLLVVTRLVGSGEKFGAFAAPRGRELLRAGAVAGAIVLATAVMPVIGFVPAFVLLIALLLFGLEGMRSWSALVTVVVVPAAAYWLFGMMLGVRLPAGPLGL